MEWKHVADKYNLKWQFPHCIGSIDGKHVVITAPKRSGSIYFNYKGTFSIVLLGVVDADYNFLYIDVGGYGKNSDSSIFAECTLGKELTKMRLNFPSPEPLADRPDIGSIPYCFVADEAFPLLTNLMRPYPARNSKKNEEAFNYRLSRARRVVENAFGILANRWRIFHTKIGASPDMAMKIVKACCVLHNMLGNDSGLRNIVPRLEEEQQDSGCIVRDGSKSTKNAIAVREQFTKYFTQNPLSWQNEYLARGSQ